MKLSTHVSSQFDEDLTRLRSLILEMGGLVESQIADVIEIYTTGTIEKVQTIIDADVKINEFEKRIDDDCTSLIAKRQPAASDLRLVFGITKIVTDLERVGDETKRMAKVIRRIIENNHSFPRIVNIRHIAEAALAILKRHPATARAVAIGAVAEGRGVSARTALGTVRRLMPPSGEQLPRIC